MSDNAEEAEFLDEDDTSLDDAEARGFSQAVLYASDWTVETIVSQLTRGNIEMNPRFQRRDAWPMKGKGRFIESVILGLPIPQIVLAEKKGQRGRFIVLDGKQRLLSLLQFTGNAAEPKNNGFALSGLEVRDDLQRRTYARLSTDPSFQNDWNAFLNHTIRAVVIRNWPNTDFLHVVFLRLNTGSVRLSPQELRQAMVPGPFSDYVDDAAIASETLRTLLSRRTPDPRMRDVELLVRFLAFTNFLSDYKGRIKSFLDDSCERLNSEWDSLQNNIQQQVSQFDLGVEALLDVFGTAEIARKGGSRSFNRAIFDALIFYASDERIRDSIIASAGAVHGAYAKVLNNPEFAEAVESDTAGLPHTYDRLRIWGDALNSVTGLGFTVPALDLKINRISFNGFW